MYPYGGFEYFVKSGFDREPLMLGKQMIPHLKALDVGAKICQEELCSSIRDNHATYLVKDILFLPKGTAPEIARKLFSYYFETTK